MSLPSWERGLKHHFYALNRMYISSLPSWERGLKHGEVRETGREVWSLPSWERGLKLFHFGRNSHNADVAPFVGAWIETLPVTSGNGIRTVAPFVGAWIETIIYVVMSPYFPSLPSWERGLKRQIPSGRAHPPPCRSLRGSVD